MYERIFKQVRERIRTRQYVMTVHAEEEMSDDNLSIFDIERVILTGKILERQKNKNTKSGNTLLKGKPFQPAWLSWLVNWS